MGETHCECSSPREGLGTKAISSVSPARSSIYSGEDEDSEEEEEEDEEPEDNDGDDDYVDEAALDGEDDYDPFIKEVIVPIPPPVMVKRIHGKIPPPVTTTRPQVKLPVPVSATVTTPLPTTTTAATSVPPAAPVIIATTSNNIQSLLELYGEAVLRCSLDHTPATAAKLEDNIARASQAVVDFHKSTILQVEQTSGKIDSELVRRLQLASTNIQDMRVELIDKSNEITRKDGEAKAKDEVCRAALRDKSAAEEKLNKIRQETEAKRKRVEESVSKASKKANV